MFNKSKRTRLALLLCGSMIASCISWPGLAPAQVAQAAQAVETPEFTLPTGGLKQIEAYEISEEAAKNVPSYDNGISLYSNTIFDQGTGDYGYNCLSDQQKVFYNSLETSLSNFNASDEAKFTGVSVSGSTKYTPFEVNYTDANIDKEQAVQTWVAFQADHPWLFWLGGYASSTAGDFMPMVEEDYGSDVATVKALNKTVENGVQEYITAVNGINGTYEKVRIIHDKIVNKVNYAYKADGKTPEDANWAHSIIGVFDSEHDTVVCEGYAKTFAFVLNILDIPNVYVVGDAGGGHAWNAVSFDGGSTYYYIDVTWDDQGGKSSTIENTYIYFAMPKDKFELRHTPDTTEGEGFDWQYEMPNLGNDMSMTYFVKYLAYATDDDVTDVTSATKFLESAKEQAPGETCLMLLGDEAIKLVAQAEGAASFSYTPAGEYSMKLYATPSGKTPDATPSAEPGESPSAEPGESPSADPSVSPSAEPSETASAEPGESPSAEPSETASAEPSETASAEPTETPTATPSATPTNTPSATPGGSTGGTGGGSTGGTGNTTPTAVPTTAPTAEPTTAPTAEPTTAPSVEPTTAPTAEPTTTPSAEPTTVPTAEPTTTVVQNQDGTTTETTVSTVENENGDTIKTTEEVQKDADGKITGSSIKTEISAGSQDDGYSIVVDVKKDGNGEIAEATATISGSAFSGTSKILIQSSMVEQIIATAGTAEVTIEVKSQDNSRTIIANASDLTAGNKLSIVQKKADGTYVLVNAKTYTVTETGDISVSIGGNKTYELINSSAMNKLSKSILNTIKVKNASKTVKKSGTIKMTLKKTLDMDNVKSIKYTVSKKAIAKVNKKGVVTGKKSGTTVVKAKVTLKNGKTKTVKMKVKVKK